MKILSFGQCVGLLFGLAVYFLIESGVAYVIDDNPIQWSGRMCSGEEWSYSTGYVGLNIDCEGEKARIVDARLLTSYLALFQDTQSSLAANTKFKCTKTESEVFGNVDVRCKLASDQ